MSQLTITPQHNTTQPLRVLMVEDSPYDAELEIEELRQGGFSPIFQRVETQEEMEQALHTETWELILSDYSMPLFSGPDALEVLKKSGLDIPFIIVSGTVGEEIAVASLKAGAHDFLVKGQFSRLIPAVQRELTEAESRRAARHLEKKFLATFEQAAVGLAHVDELGKLRFLNNKFCQILKYTKEELIGLSLLNVIHPDDVKKDSEIYQQLLKKDIHFYSTEKRCMRKDLSVIWANLTISVVWDEENQFDYSILVIEDISQRKQAELALKESEERFRTMADQAPILIWQSNAEGNLIYANKRWMDFTGHSILENCSKEWLAALHPDDQDKVFSVYTHAIQAQAKYEVEYRLRRYDGEYHWILDTGVPRYTQNGDFLGFIGTCHDFTDRKKVEEDLQKYAILLERSNKELEQFATIASHDLQEPLRKILIFSDMLVGLVPEEGKDYIGRMQNSAKRMQTLITDLLALSRVTRKGQPFKVLNLNEVLINVLEDIQVAIDEAHGEVTSEALGIVYADEGQVRQLFQNLIGNALKYHRHGEQPIVKIYGKFVDDASSYQTTVEDNGIGIAEEFYERIFEPFQRLHGLTEYPGSGMGLTICKKILERHGGSLKVESNLEKGSKFHFTLPVQSPENSKIGDGQSHSLIHTPI